MLNPFAFNLSERQRFVSSQALMVRPGSRVLDVGAGRGRYRSLFSHCEYRTQDFGKETGTLGQYTELNYVSDITSIPVEDGSFDVVLCTEVLEHVPEPILAIIEMARIIKPGGLLILTAPLGSFLHQEPYHFYGGYTPHWYRKFLPEAGFNLISIEANRGFFSWFGQESQRFSLLLDPRKTLGSGWRWPLLSMIWMITLPFCWVFFPMIGRPLDKLGFERIATVGYHVVARKEIKAIN